MNKRPLLLCSAAYLTGIFLSLWRSPVPVLLIPVCFLLYCRRRRAAEIVLGAGFVLLFFLLGYVLFERASLAYDRDHSHFLEDKKRIDLQGQISGKQWKGDRLYVTLDDVRVQQEKPVSLDTKVLLLCRKDRFCYGDILLVKGDNLAFVLPGNPGEFDEVAYYRSRNISGRISEASGGCVAGATGPARIRFLLQEMLWRLRNRIASVYQALMPGEEGGILNSICLGDRSALSFEARNLFSDAGIAHVLAISGLHVSMVGGFLFRRLRSRGITLSKSAIISSVLVLLYGMLTGGGISVRRSILMYFVLMGSYISGEAYDLISGASLAFLILLIGSPLGICDSGLILSFSAVCGVGFVAAPMHGCFFEVQRLRFEATHKMIKGSRFRPSAWQSLTGSFFSALWIQLFMLPVTAFVFHRFCVYTIFLNVLVIPLLGLILSWGLMGGVLGCFSSVMGQILLWPCHRLIFLYEFLGDWAIGLPFGRQAVGSPGIFLPVLYYSVLLALPVLMERYVSRLKKEQSRKLPWKKRRYFGVVGSLRLEAVSVLVMTCLVFALFYHPGEVSFVMLDVGQGDGLVVSGGEGVDLIDGGSSQKSKVGEYTILPYLSYRGISRIDLWFLTHMDTDHVSGCVELLQRGFPIGEILMPQAVDRSKENYRTIQALCKKRKIPIGYLSAGDVICREGATYTVIYPDAAGTHEEDGNNENSLVMLLTMKKKEGRNCTFMLTGDMGKAQEDRILQSETYRSCLKSAPGRDEAVDILKAAHHGSKNSNSTSWLMALQPKLCLVSAGRKNRYGHPHKEVLDRLEDAGCDIDRTDRSGCITIRLEEDAVSITRFRR